MAVLLAAIAIQSVCSGDEILLKGGQKMTGMILGERNGLYAVLGDAELTTMFKSSVDKVTYDSETRPGTAVQGGSTSCRLPNWRDFLTRLTGTDWALPILFIPSTVITNRVFRNVPYVSFSCGMGCEVNIYGDLEQPAGVEVGIKGRVLNSPNDFDYHQDRAFAFLRQFLTNAAYAEALDKLDRKKDKRVVAGLTLEVTPPSGEDADGGWWLSIYDVAAADGARATDAELAEITVQSKAPTASADRVAAAQNPPPPRYVATATPAVTAPPSALPNNTPAATGTYAVSASTYGSRIGSVYVHSYTRKDGTYVRSHTRKK